MPTVNVKPEKTIKAVEKEHMKTATEPVRPIIQQSTSSSITIKGKIHQLPTKKRIPAERVCICIVRDRNTFWKYVENEIC